MQDRDAAPELDVPKAQLIRSILTQNIDPGQDVHLILLKENAPNDIVLETLYPEVLQIAMNHTTNQIRLKLGARVHLVIYHKHLLPCPIHQWTLQMLWIALDHMILNHIHTV